MSPTDIYRTLHPNAKECTFSSAPYGTVFKIDHILRQEENLTIRKTETITCILTTVS